MNIRINKEIQNFNNKNYLQNKNYSKNIINFFKNINTEIISVDNNYYLQIWNNNNFLILLSIPVVYPFNPYKIFQFNNYLLNINYNKYLYNIYNNIKYKNQEIFYFFYRSMYLNEPNFINKQSCYCCNSITCNNLWSPVYTFQNILLEIIEIEFIKKYSTNLKYKYLLNIYNFFNNLLPYDIIEKIINNI